MNDNRRTVNERVRDGEVPCPVLREPVVVEPHLAGTGLEVRKRLDGG